MLILSISEISDSIFLKAANKSGNTPFINSIIHKHAIVIPAKAGIQSFKVVADHLDSGFHRSDDFLQDCQSCGLKML